MMQLPSQPAIDVGAVAVLCAIAYSAVSVRADGLKSWLVRSVMICVAVVTMGILFLGIHKPVAVYGFIGVACAAFLAVVVLAFRARRQQSGAFVRFVIAGVALAIAALVLLNIVSPVMGYSMLCLALGSVYLFDLLRDESARRRRVAPLTPRPVAEAVPMLWLGLAVVSMLMLAPYVILGEEPAGALMVGVCALALACIGWRLATAPFALEGDCDPRSEYMRERAARHQKVGLCAVIAIGSIFVFVTFEDSNLPVVLPLQRLFVPLSMSLWAGLWAWVTLYSRHLDRLSDSAS